MLPVASINPYSQVQASLAGTPLPESAVTHVPYDNVAPSLSNAQVDNNASPNTAAIIAAEDTPPPQIETADAQAPLSNAAAQASSGAQATFLAQLMTQDGSPATQVILVQYEKLIALGNVKYKPSDALKPNDAPASLFGRILQETKPDAPVQQTRQAPPAPAPSPASVTRNATVVSAANVASPAPRQPVTRSPSSSNTPTNRPAQIAHAYAATASRVDTQEHKATMELA